MRKIEEQIITALKQEKTKQLTKRDRVDASAERVAYTLWSTTVFYINKVNPLFQLQIQTGGWNTRTTQSRLSHLLQAFGLPLSICQRKGEQCVYNHMTKKTKAWAGELVAANQLFADTN